MQMFANSSKKLTCILVRNHTGELLKPTVITSVFQSRSSAWYCTQSDVRTESRCCTWLGNYQFRILSGAVFMFFFAQRVTTLRPVLYNLCSHDAAFQVRLMRQRFVDLRHRSVWVRFLIGETGSTTSTRFLQHESSSRAFRDFLAVEGSKSSEHINLVGVSDHNSSVLHFLMEILQQHFRSPTTKSASLDPGRHGSLGSIPFFFHIFRPKFFHSFMLGILVFCCQIRIFQSTTSHGCSRRCICNIPFINSASHDPIRDANKHFL